jgi:mannose-6-phosphate isomerase-like protein (cupin superfamily)
MESYAREERPWGSFEIIRDEETFKAKVLEVLPGKRLSKQYHNHRHETWVIAEGRALVEVGLHSSLHGPGDVIRVPAGEVHRVENVGEVPVIILELQRGTYFGEDDIVRLEDDWGRAGEAGNFDRTHDAP